MRVLAPLCWVALLATGAWAVRPATLDEAAAAVGEQAIEAVESGEMGLATCLALARVAHEDVIIAQARIRDAHERSEAQKADRKPRFDVSADGRLGNFGATVFDPTGGGSLIQNAANVELYFNATWTILNPQRRKLIARARHVEEQTRAASRGMLRDLDVAVAQAFFDVIRTERITAVRGELLELDENAARIASVREKVGDGTNINTLQAEAQLEQGKQELLAAENAEEKARLGLVSAMGLSEDPGLRFAPTEPPLDLEIPSLADCLDLAYASRDDIEELQAALDIAQIDVKLANLGRRISYDLSASAYSAASQGLALPNWQLAFSARLPLYDGGRAKAELRSAEARQIISEAEVSAVLRRAWVSVTGAYRDLESAREQLLAARAAEGASGRSMEGTTASFRAGVASFFDTLEARRQYAQTQQQVIESETAFLRALWDLDRAAPGAVAGVNPLSDPASALEEAE